MGGGNREDKVKERKMKKRKYELRERGGETEVKEIKEKRII